MCDLKIENRLKESLAAGVNVFCGVELKERTGMYETISEEINRIIAEFTLKLPEGYAESRKLYRNFGIDPTKNRPSSEALWRRVKRGMELPRINPVVDLTNFLSLKFQVSFGLYDISRLLNKIVLRTGEEGESYKGIRKERINLRGKPVLADDSGPFGNPSSDSMRTSTSESSSDILQVLFFLRSSSMNQKEILNLTVEYFSRFFNMEKTESYII